jgi:hypothetical protein
MIVHLHSLAALRSWILRLDERLLDPAASAEWLCRERERARELFAEQRAIEALRVRGLVVRGGSA